MSVIENMNGIRPITLESETLQAMKHDMDEIINKTIKTMQMSQSSEGTVTVKLKISIENRGIANENDVPYRHHSQVRARCSVHRPDQR